MSIQRLEKDDKISPDSIGWQLQFLSMSELEDPHFLQLGGRSFCWGRPLTKAVLSIQNLEFGTLPWKPWTDSCCWDTADVTLAYEDRNSKLDDIVAVALTTVRREGSVVSETFPTLHKHWSCKFPSFSLIKYWHLYQVSSIGEATCVLP